MKRKNIADFVPGKIIEYINTGFTIYSVNFPSITLPDLSKTPRFIHIHKNEPGILAKINNVLAKYDIKKDVVKELKLIKSIVKFIVLY